MIVDVHTHFAPASVLAAARRGQGFDGMTARRDGGQEWLVHCQGFRWPVPPGFYDLTARLAAMDQRGIGHAVLSVAPQLFMYWAGAAGAAGFCREVNDELAAFAAGSGGGGRRTAARRHRTGHARGRDRPGRGGHPAGRPGAAHGAGRRRGPGRAADPAPLLRRRPPRARRLLPDQPDRQPAGHHGRRGPADLQRGAGRTGRAAARAHPRRRLPALPDRQAGPRAPGPPRIPRLRASPVGLPVPVLVRHRDARAGPAPVPGRHGRRGPRRLRHRRPVRHGRRPAAGPARRRRPVPGRHRTDRRPQRRRPVRPRLGAHPIMIMTLVRLSRTQVIITCASYRRRGSTNVCTSAPNDHSGAAIVRAMVIEWDVPVTMDDGLVLRADVFRPDGPGRHPVILSYGPYAKGLAFQEGYADQWRLMVAKHPDVPRGSGNQYANWETADPEKWVPGGYACVRVDSRGAGRSPGFLDPFSPRETRDLYECVEWAAAQAWSTGKVGINGISYYAMNAWHVAGLQPPHLAAICVWEGAADFYRDATHHGGVLSTFFRHWYDKQVTVVQHGVGDRGPRSAVTGEPVAGPETLPEDELAAARVPFGEEIRAHPLDDEFHR